MPLEFDSQVNENSNFPSKLINPEAAKPTRSKELYVKDGKVNIPELITNLKFEKTDIHPLQIHKPAFNRATSLPHIALNTNTCLKEVQQARPRTNSEPLTKVTVNTETAFANSVQTVTLIKGTCAESRTALEAGKPADGEETAKVQEQHQVIESSESAKHETFTVGAKNKTDVKLHAQASKKFEEISTPTTPPRPLTEGKVKKVWRDKLTAFATPLKPSDTAELREELNTVNQIKSTLFTLDLHELLTKSGKFSNTNDMIVVTNHILQHFGTMQDFAAFLRNTDDAIDAKELLQTLNGDLHQSPGKLGVVTERDAQALINIFRDAAHQSDIDRMCLSGDNIQLDIREAAPHEIIEGKFTLKMDLASGDLEDFIRSPDFANRPMEEVLDICAQLAKGLSDLHRAGFVHADLKPENILIYKDKNGKIKVKISDFGKTQKIQPDQHAKYSGNPRYSPPETRISMRGETFCGGAVMIRILEEWVLKTNETMLRQPTNKSLYAKAMLSTERRGFEKYLCESADCPQNDTYLRHFEQRTKRTPTPASELGKAQVAVFRYIDALGDRFELKSPQNTPKIDRLVKKLKEMMQSDSSKRPTMSEVTTFFAGIGRDITPIAA